MARSSAKEPLSRKAFCAERTASPSRTCPPSRSSRCPTCPSAGKSMTSGCELPGYLAGRRVRDVLADPEREEGSRGIDRGRERDDGGRAEVRDRRSPGL